MQSARAPRPVHAAVHSVAIECNASHDEWPVDGRSGFSPGPADQVTSRSASQRLSRTHQTSERPAGTRSGSDLPLWHVGVVVAPQGTLAPTHTPSPHLVGAGRVQAGEVAHPSGLDASQWPTGPAALCARVLNSRRRGLSSGPVQRRRRPVTQQRRKRPLGW